MKQLRIKLAKYIAPSGVTVLTHKEFENALHVAQHSIASEIMEYVRLLNGVEHWGECVWKYLCRKYDETK